MLPELEQLIVLQDRDTRRFTLDKTLKQLPVDRERAKAQLADDTAKVQQAKDELQQNALQAKTLDLDIETRRTTIGRLKTQQFETKKNDEFRALESEVARYGEQIDELETEQLQLMEDADALTERVETAKAGLVAREEIVKDELEKLDQLEVNCRQELEELAKERARLTAEIPAAPLSLYERILKSKGDLALAPVRNNSCGGCHMKLVPHTLATLRANKELANCENCSRILFDV